MVELPDAEINEVGVAASAKISVGCATKGVRFLQTCIACKAYHHRSCAW